MIFNLNLRAHRALANEITEIGAKLYDSLGKEKELRVSREKAINFIDNISLESNSEQVKEKFIILGLYREMCERNYLVIRWEYKWNAKIHFEFGKRLKNIRGKNEKKNYWIRKSRKKAKVANKCIFYFNNVKVKPAFMDEYERLERELEKIYEEYIEKFRNLDYLEHELDVYNMMENEKFEET